MRTSRIIVVAVGLCAVPACGAREGLLDDPFGEPRDAAARDAFADRDAGPVGTCSASPSFEITRDEATLAYPRVARAGDRALLVATRMLGRPEELFAVPIDLRGSSRGPIQELGVGKGGTIVGRTLDPSAVGFTVSYTDIEGAVRGAVLDGDAMTVEPTSLGWSHDGLRPMLVLTSRLAANAWNPIAPGSLAEGFVQDLESRRTTDLRFDARDPFGVPSTREGSFRAAVHDGTHAIVTTLDARGALGARSTHAIPPMGFPASISVARVVEGIDDAVVLGGGTVRALQDAIVHVERAVGTHTFFLPNDWLFDLDAAFDPTTGWLAVAAGISHDEGIGRIATPHVFLFAMARDGSTQELVVAGPIDDRTEVHPAILWTGLADAPFLIVWEADPPSTIRGALVDCD